MSRYCPVCGLQSHTYDQDQVATLLERVATGTPVAALLRDIEYSGQSEWDDAPQDRETRIEFGRILADRGGEMPPAWADGPCWLPLGLLPMVLYRPGDFQLAYERAEARLERSQTPDTART